MDKLVTKAQRKNRTDRDLIIQTLMLIETNQDNEFTSFRTNDINAFVTNHSNSISTDKIDVLKAVMNKFNESFDNTVKIPVTSIPMILHSRYQVIKSKKSFQS